MSRADPWGWTSALDIEPGRASIMHYIVYNDLQSWPINGEQLMQSIGDRDPHVLSDGRVDTSPRQASEHFEGYLLNA